MVKQIGWWMIDMNKPRQKRRKKELRHIICSYVHIYMYTYITHIHSYMYKYILVNRYFRKHVKLLRIKNTTYNSDR